MQNTPSRARPSGGWWKMAVIPASGDVTEGTPQLEFFVSSGSGDEVDKPAGGDSYRCNVPGGFKLQHGRLRPFPRARAAPTMLASPPCCPFAKASDVGRFVIVLKAMHSVTTKLHFVHMLKPPDAVYVSVLAVVIKHVSFVRLVCMMWTVSGQVSDLDGTMVGDGEEADAGTREFCSYWEDNAALSGGVLVYNTGRSLGQFMGLWQSKAGALSLPDVLITAVGTKVITACLPPGVPEASGKVSLSFWRSHARQTGERASVRRRYSCWT